MYPPSAAPEAAAFRSYNENKPNISITASLVALQLNYMCYGLHFSCIVLYLLNGIKLYCCMTPFPRATAK